MAITNTLELELHRLERYVEERLRHNIQDSIAWDLLGFAKQLRGESIEGVAYCSHAVKLRTQAVRNSLLRACFLDLCAGRLFDAIRQLNTLLCNAETRHEVAVLLRFRGMALSNIGSPRKGLEDLELSNSIIADSPITRKYLAITRTLLGDTGDQALADFELALAGKPDDVVCLVWKARHDLARQDPKAADDTLTLVLRILTTTEAASKAVVDSKRSLFAFINLLEFIRLHVHASVDVRARVAAIHSHICSMTAEEENPELID